MQPQKALSRNKRGYSMKKRLPVVRFLISMCAVLGWWGFLYPELALTPDTVKISVEEGEDCTKALPTERRIDSSLYLELLNAGRDKITFRSKLLTDLSTFLEAFHDRNEDK